MSQVRVDPATHEVLRSLSTLEGKSMSDIIFKAVEEYRKKRFLEGLSEDFEAMKGDSKRSEEYRKEMESWDNALQDGLSNQ